MPSLYSKYLLEKEGKQTIETDKGFITYKLVHASGKDIVHVCVLYIDPEHRNASAAREMMNLLKDMYSDKCKAFTAAVYTKQFNTTNTLKILLYFGFEVVGLKGDEILLYKEF
jgi:ribosomal protein S18 acetylase RimI-like enzyme